MHSLFNYMTSLEDADPATPKGEGSDDKIAEGGELKPDETGKKPDDTEGGDPPEGKKGEDTTEGAGGADTVEGGGANADDTAETPDDTTDVDGTTTPDTPIDGDSDEPEEVVFADIGNLQVDEVDKQIGEKQEERDAQVEDAIEEAETLNATMEAIREQIATQGFLSPSMGRLATRTLQRSRKRVGMKVRTYNVSQEDFVVGNKQKTSQLTLEGFRDTIKTIYNAIMEAIAKAIAWLKRVIMGFIMSVKATRKNVERRSEALLKLRLDSGKALSSDPKKGSGFDQNSGFGKARLMSVQSDLHYISMPSDFNALTLKGKQPGMTADAAEVEKLDNYGQVVGVEKIRYTEAYARMTRHLKSIREAFNNVFLEDDKFVGQAQQAALNLMAGMPFTDDGFQFTAKAFEGPAGTNRYLLAGADGSAPPPGFAFAVTAPFLGNWSVRNTFRLYDTKTTKEKFESITNWNMTAMHDAAPFNDGWLRYLSTPEIKETSTKVLELCDELMDMEKLVDSLEKLEKRLERMSKIIVEKASDPMTQDVMSKAPPTGDELSMQDIMSALNSIKVSMTGTTVVMANNMHRAATAWANYLQAHYVKDFKLVNGDASVLQKAEASIT